ncbi:FAD-dependent oxidoreductase [Microbacterium album]|uniref:Monooxygenase n=1 Tax=Microbacterium album TaxID=2053191 RepID=A0A917IIQ8_9MICO|nr:NAD(P)/FAD-dependent oxidoreductase [Microbacterium album]GGH51566.1 monooxygenase [Microbacterium album]
MNTLPAQPVAVVGAGPAGIATALALHTVDIPVKLYERYSEPRAAGNIVNLWAPAVKALFNIGVDIDDIGAECVTEFQNHKRRVRARVRFPNGSVEKWGGFLGLTRPDLYERMTAALPDGMLVGNSVVTGVADKGDHVELSFQDGSRVSTPLVVGADGINSVVRKLVWGAPPMREHDLHVIGGYTYEMIDTVPTEEAVVAHSRTIQGSHTGIRSKGRDGYEWWVLEAWDHDKPAPVDLKRHALTLARDFPPELSQMIRSSTPDHIFRWPIRDRGPVPETWSKGRVTFAGDAVHATSPYAAYGAGMSIVDGYFLGQLLNGVDLADRDALTSALKKYEGVRVAHTAEQVARAHMLGRIFHKVPAPIRPIRDYVFDHTGFLQKQVGDSNPAAIAAQLEEMGEDIFTPAPALATAASARS